MVLSAQALILVPVDVLLLLPAIGFARALAASQLDSVPVDPERRDNLLAATPPARWLLLSVAAFGAVSLFQAARMRGAPWPVGLALILERLLPNLGPAAEIMALVLVAFVTIAIHYLLLVELPYTLGQRGGSGPHCGGRGRRSRLPNRLSLTWPVTPRVCGQAPRFIRSPRTKKVRGVLAEPAPSRSNPFAPASPFAPAQR